MKLKEIILLLFTLPTLAHEGPHFSHFKGVGDIQLDAPSDVEVQMQVSKDLSGEWANYRSSRFANHRRTMSFQVPLDARKSFFRFIYKPLPLTTTIKQDGTTVLDLQKDLPLKEFIDLFYLETGYNLHARLMNSGLASQIDQLIVSKGSYELGNPEDFSEQLGVELWVESSEVNDDSTFEDTYKPNTGDQGTPLVGPVGDSPMGEWSDLNTRPYGEIINEKNEVMADDLKPDPISGKEPQDDTEVTFSGKTLRIFLSLNDDNYRLDSVVIDNESGNDHRPFGIPQIGDFVYVIRNEEQEIEFVGRIHNPFRIHADHNLDERVGAEPDAQSGRMVVSMPLNNGSQSEIVSKTIDVFRLDNSMETLTAGLNVSTILTPDLIEKNKAALKPMYSLPTNTIFEFLAGGVVDNGLKTTELFRAGSNASKFNIAVIGDGFDSSQVDQNAFIDYVNDTIVNDLFVRDIHPEIRNSINLFRICTISEDSGVTQVNSSGTVTVSRDTALDYRYSNTWSRCWMEKGPNADRLLNEILADVCPQADFIIIVLNESGFGGCRRGDEMAGTLGSGWDTMAHEFGHVFGNLGDEYGFDCQTSGTNANASCRALYEGGPPSWIRDNLTVTTDNEGGKWGEWIPSWRNTPTPYNRPFRSKPTSAEIADCVNDVSVFAGATGGGLMWRDGIWRPSLTGRMDNNPTLHNPIGYDIMRQKSREKTEATFRKNVVGDFDGDGHDDLVLHDGRQLSLYLSRDRTVGTADPLTGVTPRQEGSAILEKTWFHNDKLWGDDQSHSWQVRPGDQYYVADFNGDGRDDLFVFNSNNWSKGYCGLLKSEGNRFQIIERYDGALPGWNLKSRNKIYIGDFDGDGRDDFLIYNGQNWRLNYLGLYFSEGSFLRPASRINGRVNDEWFIGDNENFHIGDFNGDGKDDFLMVEQTSWLVPCLRAYSYSDTERKYVQLGEGNFQSIRAEGNDRWWLGRQDNVLVGDFDGDGKDDVALHNGQDWNNSYIGFFSVSEGDETLVLKQKVVGSLPGWGLTSGDRFQVANFDGDKDDDLVIFNSNNWDNVYLGMAASSGQLGNFSVSWQRNWIGGWHLGEVDEFKVCDFKGTGGWEDLFVYNDDWFGLLRSRRAAYQLASFNYKYINQVRYHEWGVW